MTQQFDTLTQASGAKAVRIDITRAATHALTAWDIGPGATLQWVTWPLLNLWTVVGFGVILWDQYFHPPWRAWMFGALFTAFIPIVVGIASSLSYSVRSARWPDSIVPGFGRSVTVKHVMEVVRALQMHQAHRVGILAQPCVAWGYRLLILAGPVALWRLWLVLNTHPPGSKGWWILTGGFIFTGVAALALFALEAHWAVRPSFTYRQSWPAARPIRIAAVILPLMPLSLALEGFRTQLIPEFVFSSGTIGVTMGSEAIPILAFTLAWLLSIFVIGKSVGRCLTVDELTAKYAGAQITLLRSFKDDEAGVDFSGVIVPDERWKQIRLEPSIVQSLNRYGPIVAISGDDSTIDRFGAVRKKVADDDWKDVVSGWIDASMLIVMLVGSTRSVKWELSTVIGRGKTTALLLLLPPTTTDNTGKVTGQDRYARWTDIRESFNNTPWFEAAAELDISDVIGMHFLPDGRIVAICRPNASDDDYRIGIAFSVYGMMCHDWSPSLPIQFP